MYFTTLVSLVSLGRVGSQHTPRVGMETASGAGRCDVVLFSKDRAFQLRECLRSFRLHCILGTCAVRITILWTASNAKHRTAYTELAASLCERRSRDTQFNGAEYGGDRVYFIEERAGEFATQLIGTLETSSARWTLFLVDDAVFVRDFELTVAVSTLQKHPRVSCFHLKLGAQHWYCHPSDTLMPPPTLSAVASTAARWKATLRGEGAPCQVSGHTAEGRSGVHAQGLWGNAVLQFELGCGPGDWNYPWDLCGSLYRTGDACSVVHLIHERFGGSGGGLVYGCVCRGSLPNRTNVLMCRRQLA